MIKTIASVSAAMLVSTGLASAAVIDVSSLNNGSLLPGQSFHDSNILTSEASEFEYRFNPVGTTLYDISVSATGTEEDLSVVLVGLDGATNELELATDEEEAQAGFFRFDDFETSEAFSLFVVAGGTIVDAVPFTVSVFADAAAGQEIPVPAGALLMGTAIAGFGAARRRRKAQ